MLQAIWWGVTYLIINFKEVIYVEKCSQYNTNQKKVNYKVVGLLAKMEGR